jgi:hypothetical protein
MCVGGEEEKYHRQHRECINSKSVRGKAQKDKKIKIKRIIIKEYNLLNQAIYHTLSLSLYIVEHNTQQSSVYQKGGKRNLIPNNLFLSEICSKMKNNKSKVKYSK